MAVSRDIRSLQIKTSPLATTDIIPISSGGQDFGVSAQAILNLVGANQIVVGTFEIIATSPETFSMSHDFGSTANYLLLVQINNAGTNGAVLNSYTKVSGTEFTIDTSADCTGVYIAIGI
jgi:hypothetical protein